MKGNELKNNAAVNAAINNIKDHTSGEIGYKFALTSPDLNGQLNIGPPKSGGTSTVDLSPYTWGPNGYVIGHMHNHPQGSAPNPSDVMTGVNLSQLSGAVTFEEVNFYTKNFVAVIVTSTSVYTVTIKDAAAYKAAQAEYNQSPSETVSYWSTIANNYYNQHGVTPQEAGEHALIMMYGPMLNITKQDVNSSNTNAELTIDGSNRVKTNNPCK